VNGHPIADSTYFEGVRLLPPGSLLHKTSGGAAVVRYANYVPASETAPDLGAAVYRDELAARLRQAIARRCDGLASAIVPISGGYDSRGLLACIREVYSGPLQTVSWGTSEDDPDADASIGRRVAAFYGTEHTFLRREAGHLIDDLERETLRIDAANDDPFLHHAEPAIIRHLRCDLHRTILFRGDECFGYGPPAESAYEAMGRVNVYELAQFPDLQALLRKDFLPRALESQHATIAGILERAPRFSDWSNLKDWLYIEQRLARSLNFSQYVKLSYLEARNPWLDRNVLSFFAGLPLHYRYEKSLYRETLRGMFPKVMQEIPIATRNSLENWGPVLRSPAFLNFARAHLVESRSVLHDFFDSAAISALLDRFESGAQVRSRSVSLIEIPRDLLRRYANPVYRLLKRNSAGLARRSQPAEWTIGRLLILKLWCDSLI
jgi:asparagine synthetase B (glutamine-hydrolysing)